MKNRIFTAILCCLMIFSVSAGSSSAAETFDAAKEIFTEIVVSENGSDDIQDWIDGGLTENPANGSEWYVLALAQHGSYDFTAYEQSLLSYLNGKNITSASSRLKFALCLSAVGSTDSYITKTMNEAIGKQGIMSFVFGLHLMNNGYTSDDYTQSALTGEILSLQLPDGGWTVTGENGDVDITAMTIQALSPAYPDNSDVKNAVDKALSFLSDKQEDDGDYASYGVTNPESTAQVLTALSSLNIDCMTDSRFIKNGNTLFDGIRKYRLDGGGYCHQSGGGKNAMSSIQVFHSAIAYQRMKDVRTSIYILDRNASPDKSSPVTTTETASDSAKKSAGKQADIRLILTLAIAGIGGGICVIMLLKKKGTRRIYLIIIAAIIAAAAIVWLIPPDKFSRKTIGQVTITIRCDILVGRDDSEFIPDDGIILDVTSYDIAEGDTVYDVLSEAVKDNRIHFEKDGNSETAYIQGINNLYEFDYGDLSGWVYHVNGEAPSVGCGVYELSPGDEIEWHYSCDLGRDIP